MVIRCKFPLKGLRSQGGFESGSYLTGLPSRSSLRNCGKVKVLFAQAMRDSLRSALRCERRLEPTGIIQSSRFGSGF